MKSPRKILKEHGFNKPSKDLLIVVKAGMFEVIKNVAVNSRHKLDLLRSIK